MRDTQTQKEETQMQNLTQIYGRLEKTYCADPLTGPIRLLLVCIGAQQSTAAYEFKCPMASFAEQLRDGKPTWLQVHCHYNEKTGENWYAFSTPEEKDLFLRMLECDGIGPVKALNAIARTNYTEINALIASGDRERFAKLPGVGPKTGEAMVRVLFAGAPKQAATQTHIAVIPLNMDCVMALTALGYKRPEAEARTRKAQDALPGCEDSSQLLTAALKGGK